MLAGSRALRRLWASASPAVAGVGRARRHRFVLPRRRDLPELALDILVAEPPSRHRHPYSARPLLVYVLDPEPLLFGAAALFAFSQAAYFETAEGTEEAQFRRLVVIGVGHSSESFALDEHGFDKGSLRHVRRRDFPPFDHPEITPGGASNRHARRFAEDLVDEVVPFVEGNLLGLRPDGVAAGDGGAVAGQQRCLLGASYSAVAALQVLLARPTAFQNLVFGSPSVCFDPGILQEVHDGDAAGVAASAGARAFVCLGEREKEGKTLPGNVHDRMAEGAAELVSALRRRGVQVDGVHELPGEDHSTMKLGLVSRGLTWFAHGQTKVG